MKKLILNIALFLGIALSVTAQNVYIPDANFKKYLVGRTDSINTNKDTAISVQEAEAFTGYINVSQKNIKSLMGLEAFINLTKLNCSYIYISSLNISKNLALSYLDCGFNYIQSIDVSKHTALKVFYCYITRLTTLDVSKNLALTKLDCSYNRLSSIDLSKNTDLKEFDCNNNYYLDRLDLTNNLALTSLSCGGTMISNISDRNSINSIDISKNLALQKLRCGGTILTSLNVSKNFALTDLHCDSSAISELDVSKNTNLTNLDLMWYNPNLYCIKALNSQDKTYWYKESRATYSEICNIQAADFPNNSQTLINSVISNNVTSNFVKGRNLPYSYHLTNSICKTSAIETNTIDAFYSFIADYSTASIDLTVGNSSWLSTMELLDTLTFAPISNTCQSNVGVGQAIRTYNFIGLTVGKKYLVRLELGDIAPLGHARMETVNNTFSVKLNSTVTDVADNEISSNKTISNIYNLQGLEVSKDFRGLVIYKYTDGTTQKVVQE